jgi:hypothetical protein
MGGKGACSRLRKAFSALLLCLAPATAWAQINSPVGPVALSANLPSSLTVSATPGLVNFTLVPSGISNGSATVTVTTSWSFSANARLSIYTYFTNPLSALADAASHNIPAANVSASIDGGAYTAFTGASPFAPTSSILIFTRNEPGNTNPRSNTDTLDLRINTTGLALAPGNYAGLLIIQAQAI